MTLTKKELKKQIKDLKESLQDWENDEDVDEEYTNYLWGQIDDLEKQLKDAD